MNGNERGPIDIPIKSDEDYMFIDDTENTSVRDDLQGEIQPQTESVLKETKKDRPFMRIVSLVLIAALVGGVAFGGGVAWYTDYMLSKGTVGAYYLESQFVKRAEASLADLGSNISTVDIVKNVGPSVVAITNKMVVQSFFSEQTESQGSGSGVIFNINKESVLILTNNHVVENATELLVALDAEERYAATLVGVDPISDLAVIKIDRSLIPNDILMTIQPVIFGDSDSLEVGETAIAIGNPLGYNDTVTVGVISAVNREVRLETGINTLIQTDAAINPGNSGGALVNAKGELIGINTVKISDTSVEGIGFAIPINNAKPIIEQLLSKGYVSRPYLGVSGRNVDDETSELYELPIGVVVIEVVPNSAADRLGLVRGDVIIGFEDVKITSIEQLIAEIAKHQVGDTVTITYIREGKTKMEGKTTLLDKNAPGK